MFSFKHKKTFYRNLAMFFVFGFMPFLVAAQGFSSLNFGSGATQNVNLTVNPQQPAPNQEVTVRVEGFFIISNTVNVSWYRDGALQTQGREMTTYQFTAGGNGEQTTIKAVVETQTNSVEKTVTITPGAVDVLWEADTYTPPFYKGKALPTSKSSVTLVAIPHITGAGPAKTMEYTWYENFAKNFALSGYGKNRVRVNADYAGSGENYRAVAQKGELSASGSAEFDIYEPEIVFYPRTNVLGLDNNNALKDGQEIESETLQVVAEPYFFSFRDKRDNPGRYTWELDNKKIDITGNKNAVLLQFPAEGRGRTKLELRIHNPEKLLQEAEHETTLRF